MSIVRSDPPPEDEPAEARPQSAEPGILSAVTEAVDGMSREPERVPAIAIEAAFGLGLDAVAFRSLDEDSFSHHAVGSRGFDEEPDRDVSNGLSARMADLVLERGETVVARRSPGSGEVPLPGTGHPFEAAVAGPVL